MKKRALLTALLAQVFAFTAPALSGDWFAYVGNGSTGMSLVTPINLATQAPKNSIALPKNAFDVVITPDAQKAYITAGTNDNSISVVDISTNTFIHSIPLPSSSAPYKSAITPDGSVLVVPDFGAFRVLIIDTTTDTVTHTIALPSLSSPTDVAITPDGTTAYVTLSTLNEVIPIDLTTYTTETPIPVPAAAVAIAITPDGTTAYVALSNGVVPIDLATSVVGTTIQVGSSPKHLAITPNGKTAYVSNSGSANVSPIDIETNTAGDLISLLGNPKEIAVSPDGKTVYVAVTGAFQGVEGIDTATNIVSTSIPLFYSFSLAITPDQAPHALFTATPGTAGSPTLFDASGSFSPVGTIASYQWDFGDGISLVTPSPTIWYTYAEDGTFNVTLTVTNTAGTSTFQTFTSQTVSNNGGPLATITQAVHIPLNN